MECLLLYIEFCKIGLVCVGGGYASMPLIQAVVVDQYHWMTIPQFIDIFTISQMTPGPVGVNAATFCGTRVAGLPGSIAATAGFVTPSFFLCIFVMYLLKKYGENEVVPCEYFESVINRINLGSFSKVRHLFYNQFGEK